MQHARVYETVSEMIEAADKSHKAGRIHNGSDEKSICRADFVGRAFSSWEEVMAGANSTWSEGVALVEEMLADVSTVELPQPQDRRRRQRWSSDVGDDVDNDRLRAGQDYWREVARQPCRAPQAVIIVFGLGTKASRSSTEVMWRGVTAIVLANLLEAAGYRAELFSMERSAGTYRDGSDRLTAVCLKRADQPLDLATIVNGMAGWFYRSVVFQEHYSYPSAPCTGLGRPLPLSEYVPELKELAGSGEMVVIDEIWDRAESLNKIRQVIQSLNQ
jgi:hypothetical protein